MNTQTAFSDWSVWTGPFTELQQMNQEAGEKIVRECISYYSDCAANTVKSTQTLQRVTSPEDFISTQMKLLSQHGEKTLEFIQNVSQIYQDAFKKHCNWTEDKVSNAVKTASKATSMARKNAED
ncbi:MAG TPA: phasin family protein [Gammaproteobacteria bacterium]|nr:phasin family protein [Gammaproteobacteria bacterium]